MPDGQVLTMYLHSCYFLFFQYNSLRSPICQTYAQLVFLHGLSALVTVFTDTGSPREYYSHHAFSLRFGVVTLRWHLQCVVLVAYTVLRDRPLGPSVHYFMGVNTFPLPPFCRPDRWATLPSPSDRAEHTSNHWVNLLCTSLHLGPQTVLSSAICPSNSLPCAIACCTLGSQVLLPPATRRGHAPPPTWPVTPADTDHAPPIAKPSFVARASS